MVPAKVIVFCAIIAGITSAASIPEYIHVCKRSDPDVAKCVRESVEVLRPRLRKGIPELDVPGLEPLHLNNIVIGSGDGPTNIRATLKNIDVYGASDFELTSLKMDIPNVIYRIGIKIPVLRLTGDYDVNARILVAPIKGQGKFNANATDCVATGVIKGQIYGEKGQERFKFDDLQLNLKIGDYQLYLDNLFNGDPVLSQATNAILNQNRGEFIGIATPFIQRKVSEIILEIANNIVKNFLYDEVFPEK